MNSKTILKIGDVVQYRIRPTSSFKGVIIELIPTEDESEPFFYTVYWYKFRSVVQGCDVVLCEGVESRELCNDCDFTELCSVLPDIVLCDISEFGEWRSGNKRSLELCEQRRCPHRFMCGGRRFMQEE